MMMARNKNPSMTGAWESLANGIKGYYPPVLRCARRVCFDVLQENSNELPLRCAWCANLQKWMKLAVHDSERCLQSRKNPPAVALTGCCQNGRWIGRLYKAAIPVHIKSVFAFSSKHIASVSAGGDA
jgi:hypothetical protein